MEFYLLAMIAIPTVLAFLSRLLDEQRMVSIEVVEDGRPADHEAA